VNEWTISQRICAAAATTTTGVLPYLYPKTTNETRKFIATILQKAKNEHPVRKSFAGASIGMCS